MYRFKTKEEFLREFGPGWIHEVDWNDSNDMDYLFGKPIPVEHVCDAIDENDFEIRNENPRSDHVTWYISKRMIVQDTFRRIPGISKKPKSLNFKRKKVTINVQI